MLNPHNTGATATEDHVGMAQTSVPLHCHGSFGSFGTGMVGKTTTQASRSGEQQSRKDNVFSRSRCMEQSGSFGSSFVGGDPTSPIQNPFCV